MQLPKIVNPVAEYHENVRVQARYEIAMKRFMEDGGFKAFTTNFENLTGLDQLPGLASQRLNGCRLWIWC